eukprot:Skav224095  [mRNA]  locus=scaffold4565:65497:68553:- [translate_table: standard]
MSVLAVAAMGLLVLNGFAFVVPSVPKSLSLAFYAMGFALGYLPDGTPMNRAGNAINHPETIGPDPHTPGSPLPRAIFTNSVGYLPDGTAMNAAGNAINHPETMQPDMHGVAAPAAAPAAVPMTAAPSVPPPMYVVEEPVAAAFVGASAT